MTLWFTIFFTILILGDTAPLPELEPYWRSRPTLYEKVKNQRKVLVSVKSEQKSLQKWVRIQGVGVAHVPQAFARQSMTDFERLTEISDHFDRVVHKPDQKTVDILASALGYQTRLVLQYRWAQRDNRQVMSWEAVAGPFKGMVGSFELLSVDQQKTEIVLNSRFQSHHIPIPAFLLNFTLEVIAEKVAQKMRTFMEDKYRKSF